MERRGSRGSGVRRDGGDEARVGSDKTPVRFRFTPLLGSWQIDDVYVDPFMKR